MRLSFAFLVVSVAVVMAGGLGGVYPRALRLGRVNTRTAVYTCSAAFGVFRRFQITNFYVFLGCHNISFAVSGYWFVLCKTHRTTSDARQRHSPWGSGHLDGSTFLSCALAVDFLNLRRAHFVCPSMHSLWLPINTIRARV